MRIKIIYQHCAKKKLKIITKKLKLMNAKLALSLPSCLCLHHHSIANRMKQKFFLKIIRGCFFFFPSPWFSWHAQRCKKSSVYTRYLQLLLC